MTQVIADSKQAGASDLIAERFSEIGRTFEKAAQSDLVERVEQAANVLGDAFERGKKLMIFGNGGSASDAQHLAGELVVRFQTERKALPAIALSADSAVLTACGNDFSFDEIFSRQIEALGTGGDVALAITTSGNSPNVVRALQAARAIGMATILLTGETGGIAKGDANLVLTVPVAKTARVQEVHLAVYHLICELLDARFTEVRA
jgi:D-sedoheptulose 7-phosphate isomerase